MYLVREGCRLRRIMKQEGDLKTLRMSLFWVGVILMRWRRLELLMLV